MILLDSRAGSKELETPLRALGLPIDLTMLEYGDLAFEGRGTGGKTVFVGIEYKKLPELIGAMNDGRLQGHQLPGMVQTYDYRYLLVEGEIIINPVDNRMIRRAGHSRYKPLQGAPGITEFHKRILTLAHRGALIPIFASNKQQTILFIEALYRFWTDRSLDQHKSHIAIYNRDLDSRLMRPKTAFRQVIGAIPHVGPKVLDVAESYFEGSIKRAILAPPNVWADLETVDNGSTRRIGMKTAEKIVEALR